MSAPTDERAPDVAVPTHRFPWRTTAVIVALVLVASVVAGILLTRERVGSDQPVTAPQPSASSAATSALTVADERQVTVLLTVRDDDRAAVSSMLIGVGGGSNAVSELLLPRDLLLPTDPPRRLEQVDDPTGPQTAEQPLETLLGVQVDAIVDLDRLAWAGLIDATGSRVDRAAAGQPGSFALAVDSVLEGLPYEPAKVGELLTGLGSMARTTVPNEDAGAVLALIGRNLREGDVRRESLPVTYVRAGPQRAAVADLARAEEVVRALFPTALLQPGHAGPLRVVLQDSGATVGALTQARLDLVEAGFGVVTDGTAAEPVAATVVQVPAGSDAAMAAGREVAAALGLPASAVTTVDGPGATVDVRVLAGADLAID